MHDNPLFSGEIRFFVVIGRCCAMVRANCAIDFTAHWISCAAARPNSAIRIVPIQSSAKDGSNGWETYKMRIYMRLGGFRCP